MTKILVLDPGHGGSDPGAIGNGLREKVLTLDIAKRINTKLKEYTGIKVVMTRTTDKYLTLSQRANIANKAKADAFLSIHINAGGGTGFESFIYNGGISANTRTLQNYIHDGVIKQTKVANRGKKRANFAVVRETRMPATLTECLFIDRKSDADKLKSESFLNKVAQGHVDGIVKYFKLKKKPKPKPKPTPKPPVNKDTFYRVVTGSFAERKNANDRMNALKKKGFDSFLVAFKKDGKTFYRVVTGSYNNRKNADSQVAKLKKSGFDSFLDVFKK